MKKTLFHLAALCVISLQGLLAQPTPPDPSAPPETPKVEQPKQPLKPAPPKTPEEKQPEKPVGVKGRELYVPDGQMVSSPVEVYVSNVQLSSTDKPRLVVYAASTMDGSATLELDPVEVIKEASMPNKKVHVPATLLLFDFEQKMENGETAYQIISGKKITELFSSGRFTPVLKWGAEGSEEYATTARDNGKASTIIVGNLRRAAPGMITVVVLLLGVIALLSKKHTGSFLGLLVSDGYASLAHFQLMLWTVATVTFVGIFGIAKQHLPDIPASLIVLMGLSLATTGSAYLAGARESRPTYKGMLKSIADAKAAAANEAAQKLLVADGLKKAADAELAKQPDVEGQQTAANQAAKDLQDATAMAQAAKAESDKANADLQKVLTGKGGFDLSHLLSDFEGAPPVHVMSVAKAQMFLWTIVSVVLFTSKSVMNGELWEVPWELVVLMGISQVSYLAPKYWGVPAPTTTAPVVTPPAPTSGTPAGTK